jgi:hypothetical protein
MLISFRATTERVGAVRVILILALALLLGDCANTVTETPAGIEIETLGKTPQEIADERKPAVKSTASMHSLKMHIADCLAPMNCLTA